MDAACAPPHLHRRWPNETVLVLRNAGLVVQNALAARIHGAAFQDGFGVGVSERPPPRSSPPSPVNTAAASICGSRMFSSPRFTEVPFSGRRSAASWLWRQSPRG
jgi:hypothetical protein